MAVAKSDPRTSIAIIPRNVMGGLEIYGGPPTIPGVGSRGAKLVQERRPVYSGLSTQTVQSDESVFAELYDLHNHSRVPQFKDARENSGQMSSSSSNIVAEPQREGTRSGRSRLVFQEIRGSKVKGLPTSGAERRYRSLQRNNGMRTFLFFTLSSTNSCTKTTLSGEIRGGMFMYWCKGR